MLPVKRNLCLPFLPSLSCNHTQRKKKQKKERGGGDDGERGISGTCVRADGKGGFADTKGGKALLAALSSGCQSYSIFDTQPPGSFCVRRRIEEEEYKQNESAFRDRSPLYCIDDCLPTRFLRLLAIEFFANAAVRTQATSKSVPHNVGQ